MKLVRTLKIILYVFLGIYILSLVMNPIMIYLINNKNINSQGFSKDLLIAILYSISGIIICFHGSRLLQNFEKQAVSFEKIAKSFKVIGICLIISTISYAIIDFAFQKAIYPAFWIETFGNVILIRFTGLFFIAISTIMRKADYYKSQNELTI